MEGWQKISQTLNLKQVHGVVKTHDKSVDVYPIGFEVLLRYFDLGHQLLMRLRDIVEGENAPS